ncbi:MAG: DNA replication/repair protein RecF [Wenzhouxiangellaceae bacterium]
MHLIEIESQPHLLLTALHIENFRNLESVTLAPAPGLNWLYGENGAGKTSVLEAIHVLARGRSFRASSISPLIRDGSKQFRVVARTQDPDGHAGVERSASEWTGRINRQACTKMSEFARMLPLVLVDPENHELVEGAPAVRRSFLDWGLFHVEQSYLVDWRRYSRLLRQRNAALRSQAAPPLLGALEQPMAEAAAAVEELRDRYVRSLQRKLEGLQDELQFHVGEIGLAYRPSGRTAEEYMDKWRETRGRDLEQGFTRDGPHRGDLSVRAGERMAAPRLSRGQMKLVALMLKLAQMGLARSADCEPVLLLDDPVSELDAYHLDRLLDWLGDQPNQAWITAVERPAEPGAGMFHVEQGEIHGVL